MLSSVFSGAYKHKDKMYHSHISYISVWLTFNKAKLDLRVKQNIKDQLKSVSTEALTMKKLYYLFIYYTNFYKQKLSSNFTDQI